MITLSKIEVEYLDHMGSDLSVVNAAKVSNDKRSEWEDPQNKILSSKDQNLIQYLARGFTNSEWEIIVDEIINLGAILNNYKMLSNEQYSEKKYELKEKLWKLRNTAVHFAPFTHCQVTFRFKIPIFLARQLAKHSVGGYVSEVSRRYVTTLPEFYMPKFRKKGENIKQGSSNEILDIYDIVDNHHFSSKTVGEYVDDLLDDSQLIYEMLLKHDIAAEQARSFLTLNMFTEWIITGSLVFFSRMYNQRSDPHAQKENLEVMMPISNKMKQLYPISWEALTHAK